MKNFFYLLLFFPLIAGVTFLFTSDDANDKSPYPGNLSKAKEEPETISTTIQVAAIGDVLLHERVYNAAKTSSGYDFKPMFTQVAPLLSSPDFLIVNQESMPGGIELGLSSYPIFNSPHEIVDALMYAGVDLFSQANNHTLDKGVKGIKSAIKYYEKKGIPYIGMYKNFKDQSTLRVFDVKGINLGVMSYTFDTNGIPIPAGKEYLVNVIDKKKIRFEAEQLQKVSDVVVAVVHWGDEYQAQPNDSQKEYAKFLAECGVDIIFGSHPHVLQPIEWITTKNGHQTLCMYSLGNFISAQQGDYKDIGGMAEVQITKNQTGDHSTISLDSVEFYPTYVANSGSTKYYVVPMTEAPNHGLISPTYEDVYQFVMSGATKTKETFSQWLWRIFSFNDS